VPVVVPTTPQPRDLTSKKMSPDGFLVPINGHLF
jgi:hypothetical protein